MRRLVAASLLLCAFSFAQSPRRARTSPANDAALALWRDSDLVKARSLAAAILARDRFNADALFVDMEAAALAADTDAVWRDALALCRTDRSLRAIVAGERLRALTANTADFHRRVLAVESIAASESVCAGDLRAALLAAAADGLPHIDTAAVARADGLLTAWRISGLYGRLSNLDFDLAFPPERDMNKDGEPFFFPDGQVQLPPEFLRRGVLYAAGDFDSTGAGLTLRVESPGTLAVFVDGSPVLTKDDRFRAGRQRAESRLQLAAGHHRLLVKLLASAVPFRVALAPAIVEPTLPPLPEPEATWAQAQRALLTGDLEAASNAAEDLTSRFPTAASEFFAAEVARATDASRQEQLRHLRAALAKSPAALLAELRLADALFDLDQLSETHQHLAHVRAERPHFPEALELAAPLALRQNDFDEARTALAARLRLHPSCDAISTAIRFHVAHDEFENARALERELQTCAPASPAYARLLSDTGRHAESVAELRRVLAAYPLDREARLLLIAELRLAGQVDAARVEAAALTALAPSLSTRIARALSGDERSDAQPSFYLPYRRDGLRVVEQTAHRKFSGGPAVFLLRERVVQLAADGRLALYVHELTRVLDRDGIERYGEVAVPPGASILELRTVKADGTVLEPELAQGKPSISMPGLAPGDAVDVEYVVRFAGSGGLAAHPEIARFTFGSFAAPVLNSRFVFLAPNDALPRVVARGDAPSRVVESQPGVTAWIWERHDITQFTEEVGAPADDALPSVTLLAPEPATWAGVQNGFRDDLIEAARITPPLVRLAARLRGRSDEDTARALFRYVGAHIAPADSAASWDDADLVSADQTLADGEGSRTALLVALARAAGLDADVVLARPLGAAAESPSLAAFTRPLVRLRLHDGRELFCDIEQDLAAFGALPPAVDRARALVVSLRGRDETFAALPPLADAERSTADADLVFDANGDLHATLRIHFGAARAAEVRAALRTIAPADRQQYFERLATRIFPGADAVTGAIADEFDPERPLVLTVTCRAAGFLDVAAAGRALDLDQLVPTLGLRKLYPDTPARAFPLDLTSLLFETATFRVSLPANLTVERLPAAAHLASDFGAYDLAFATADAHHFEVTRAFRVPAQRIAPAAWPDFSRFAGAIDAAERQRISLAVAPALAQR